MSIHQRLKLSKKIPPIQKTILLRESKKWDLKIWENLERVWIWLKQLKRTIDFFLPIQYVSKDSRRKRRIRRKSDTITRKSSEGIAKLYHDPWISKRIFKNLNTFYVRIFKNLQSLSRTWKNLVKSMMMSREYKSRWEFERVSKNAYNGDNQEWMRRTVDAVKLLTLLLKRLRIKVTQKSSIHCC